MSGRRLLGFGAAACVACCAPLLLSVGGIAAVGLAGTLIFGVIAILVAVVLIVVLLGLRRRGQTRAQAETQPVQLGPPRR